MSDTRLGMKKHEIFFLTKQAVLSSAFTLETAKWPIPTQCAWWNNRGRRQRGGGSPAQTAGWLRKVVLLTEEVMLELSLET